MQTQTIETGRNHQTTYLKRPEREKYGSDAFNLEYDTAPTREELKRETISYLAEYRLQIPKFSYELLYGRGLEGDYRLMLRDINRGEPMQHKTKRVIEEREIEKKPTHREEAEDKGVSLLDQKLQTAKTGDTVIWVSPPGPKEQGYGEYGFVFVGKVTKFADGFRKGEAHVAMTAIRVENPILTEDDTDEKGNELDRDALWVKRVNSLVSNLSSETVSHTHTDQFLADPKLVQSDISPQMIDHMVREHFEFKYDEVEQKKMQAIISQMEPMIDDFTLIMQTGTKEQKIKALHTLENYAIKLKEEGVTGESVVYRKEGSQPRLGDVIDDYGHRPPPVAGSCGKSSSGSTESNSLSSLSGGSVEKLAKDKYGERTFNCPDCGWENTREENKLLTNCQHCNSEKVAC